ncbi:thioredoxin-like protein [Hypoxylon sp. NC1633]|nr:thioredoxin-like protein [Hypoxylon sp. NC1633]
MGGRIEIYLDIASLYSYIALIQVLNTRELLKQHSVEVELYPVLLGAINAASGNKPPWTLPAKRKYGGHDSRRSLSTVGLTQVSPPGDLMEAGRTQLALRALHHIKATYPEAAYLATWRHFLHAFWTLHVPPTNPSALRAALEGVPAPTPNPSSSPSSSSSPDAASVPKPLFTTDDVDRIASAAEKPEYKDLLRRTTEEALSRGAFGAPWLWVTDAATGRGEPFFGSDRWSHVYEFLGLPYRDVTLLPPGAEEGSRSKSKSKL